MDPAIILATDPAAAAALAVATLVVLGTLIGLEIPLLTRIARRYGSLRDTLANVLAFDYLGALAASLEHRPDVAILAAAGRPTNSEPAKYTASSPRIAVSWISPPTFQRSRSRPS